VGKSFAFQLPALLQTGLTLVVSPLVALMENQVQELRDRNLPAAHYIVNCHSPAMANSTVAGATTAEIALPVARNAAE